MCTMQFRKNREELGTLIAEMRFFSQRELVDRFSKGRDSIAIDGWQPISDYLMQLREAKVLGYEGGLYYLRD